MNKCLASGVCCRLFLINLNEEEYNSGKYETELGEFGHIKDFKKAEACGANILKKKEDGSCVYLKDNMCSIHATRPQSCRAFFCTSKKRQYKDMIAQINNVKNKK
ncbi:YkgJ family cysteine cluster protein [Nanoarchaeota archaeon]